MCSGRMFISCLNYGNLHTINCSSSSIIPHSCMLTYDVYGNVLVCNDSSTISTHNQGGIEVCSGIDCCSWCNGSCYYLCDSKLKWRVREHLILITSEKRPIDVKGWNRPLMCRSLNCTCKCHSFSRTWSLHTGLQLSTWNWKRQTQTQCISTGTTNCMHLE